MDPDHAAHCPNCLAEYRWGVSVCTDCGSQLLPGPSPAMEDGWAEDTVPGRVEVVRLPAQGPEKDPQDRFGREERPTRVILCRIDQDDAEGLVAALDEEGIGARLGGAYADGTAQVLVHDAHLGEAQAVMVDYTGDPSLVDDVAFEEPGLTGENDPAQGGFVEVASGSAGTVGLQANRLTDAGIGVRVVLPPEGADPASVAGWTSVYVSREDLAEARRVLGMEV